MSHWTDPSRLVLGADEPPLPRRPVGGWLPDGITERIMYLDLVTYLPDDILAKVDRASMSVGLEARVPLLDPRVVEFAWRLPLVDEAPGREEQVAPPAGPLAVRARRADRSTEDGVRRPDRGVVARTAARVGRHAAGRAED